MRTVTNVAPKQIVSPSCPHDGVHVILNVYKSDNEPEIAFFASKHAFHAYSPPPTLQLTTSLSFCDAPFGFAVDIKSVENFAKSVENLCRKINETSSFDYDEHNHTAVRTLSDEAEDARDELEEAFEMFIESLDFVDPQVEVIDCEDFWTLEKLKALFEPGMSDEDFGNVVKAAQQAAESEDLRILGEPSHMIDEALGELEAS